MSPVCVVGAESRAKKSRNWEEADFYDSDEDSFLDRTGDIEVKRQKRISRVKPSAKKSENFESLVSTMTDIISKLSLYSTHGFCTFVLTAFSR